VTTVAKVSLNDVCELIYVTNTVGELGTTQTEKTKKQVFCGVKSITSTEFAEVSKVGIKPQLAVVIRTEVYNDAEEVEYRDKLYSVYRAYTSISDRDYTELYLSLKEGVAYGETV
jgi:SPP1 family predicted phage head-tail adaptor